VTLFEILEERRQELAKIVTALLEMQPIDYDYDLFCNTDTLPDGGGLYLFSQKDAPPATYLYAGKARNLRARIGRGHVGRKAANNMLATVRRKHKLDAKQAKLWIHKNCRIRWVQVESHRLRAFAEDYVIAVLRPEWNHKMSHDDKGRKA
jgi:excinuclease UvrABC nuclease subunit